MRKMQKCGCCLECAPLSPGLRGWWKPRLTQGGSWLKKKKKKIKYLPSERNASCQIKYAGSVLSFLGFQGKKKIIGIANTWANFPTCAKVEGTSGGSDPQELWDWFPFLPFPPQFWPGPGSTGQVWCGIYAQGPPKPKGFLQYSAWAPVSGGCSESCAECQFSAGKILFNLWVIHKPCSQTLRGAEPDEKNPQIYIFFFLFWIIFP